MHKPYSKGKVGYVDRLVIQRLLKAADFVVLLVSSVLLFMRTIINISPEQSIGTGFAGICVALSVMLILRTSKLYDVRSLISPWNGAFVSSATAFIVGAIWYFALKLTVLPADKMWLIGWFAVSLVWFIPVRLIIAWWAKSIADAGGFHQRIAIVGGSKTAQQALDMLDGSDDLDIEIVGLFDDRKDDRDPQSVEKFPKLGKVDDLADYARSNRVDLVIVAIPMSAEARLLQMLKRLWELPVDIRIAAHTSKLKLSPRAYTNLGNLPLLAVFDRPLGGWNAFLKDVLDRVLASCMIIGLSPIMAITALAVRIESKGPIIFKQKRYGFNNELIEVYKFRSMYTDLCDKDANKLVTKGDPRVTRVGRFIRKASIDELPQLFNVLTGQLSLVGPRPHPTKAKAANDLYDEVVDGYFARHKVKPGITGWAQINGWRGETDTHEKIKNRVKFDLEYIDGWSLYRDLYIIAKTPFALLKSENAY